MNRAWPPVAQLLLNLPARSATGRSSAARARKVSRREDDPGGSAGLQTRWVAPCAAGWVRLPFPSAMGKARLLRRRAGIPCAVIAAHEGMP
jgi:hypothetical protein